MIHWHSNTATVSPKVPEKFCKMDKYYPSFIKEEVKAQNVWQVKYLSRITSNAMTEQKLPSFSGRKWLGIKVSLRFYWTWSIVDIPITPCKYHSAAEPLHIKANVLVKENVFKCPGTFHSKPGVQKAEFQHPACMSSISYLQLEKKRQRRSQSPTNFG